MLTISKALAVSQATDYYQREYTSAGESFSAEGDQITGRWHGRLAESWGLRGEVTTRQYERLCAGRHPETGEQLVRHVEPRTYLNRYGKEITTSGHRAGWDATFSAPKNVSLAAVAGGDGRVREAHRESVDAALDAVEPYTQARMGGNRPAEATGKLVAAKFEHDAARPSLATGYAAPQLHTHVVIFNVTETEEGMRKPAQPLELYRSQSYATAVYRISLAERLQKLGYEVEVDARTGAPEIRGFDPEYVRESSPRSAEVRRSAGKMKVRLESEGAAVKEGAGLRQAAARSDRPVKDYDRRRMKERVLELDAKYGHQARFLHQQALEREPIARAPEDLSRRADEAVTFVRDSALERGEAVDRRRLMADALTHDLTGGTYSSVKEEFEAREARGEFVGIVKEPARGHAAGRRLVAGADVVRLPVTSLDQAVRKLPAEEVRAAVARIQADGRVVEIRDDRARLEAMAMDYCNRPEGALVITPADERLRSLNDVIRQKLREENKIGREELSVKVYEERAGMQGSARASADEYSAGEDVLRFNRSSKVFGFEVGDYARLVSADAQKNVLGVVTEDGREITYNPARLSGVRVYRKVERGFSEGDRVRFGAPLAEHRVSGGALGTLSRIEDDGRFSVKLDGGRTVSFSAEEFGHLDYGYGVAACPSQAHAFDRVIVHADAQDSDAAINQRLQYAAHPQLGSHARIYTDDAGGLGGALDRNVERQMAVEGAAAKQKPWTPGFSSELCGGAEVKGAERAISQGIEL